DWGIALAWARTEQESVLSFLSYSDFGLGGTNVEGPIIAASWRPLRPLVLEATHHIVSPARALPGRNPNTLHRLQVDARVSF
ncbi:MAG TPA: putative porin, partial [Gemmatimonadales bacterium]